MGSEKVSKPVESNPVKASTPKQASAAGEKEASPKGKSWPVAVLLILGALIAATSYLGEFVLSHQYYYRPENWPNPSFASVENVWSSNGST